jgi:hypothetical protein
MRGGYLGVPIPDPHDSSRLKTQINNKSRKNFTIHTVYLKFLFGFIIFDSSATISIFMDF